ncbi:MAG TPA: dehydratase [Anaerolineae bacterium]|nr:dehydratase [Anaerolineae bacterium]
MSNQKHPQPPPRGRYFEDFEVGFEVVSPGRTITEADVVAFAGLSGDYNQLHTDVEFAKGTPFGKRIAHGLLGLAVASGLASRLGFVEGTAEAFLGLEWKFKKPIFIGDTVAIQAKVARTKAMPRMGGGIVIFDMALVNQRGEVVQKGQWTVLVKGKGQ